MDHGQVWLIDQDKYRPTCTRQGVKAVDDRIYEFVASRKGFRYAGIPARAADEHPDGHWRYKVRPVVERHNKAFVDR